MLQKAICRKLAIRKILGASVIRIMCQVIWGFLKLILVGSLLAIPLVIYLGNDWSNNFVFRITIDAFIIILPILIIGILAIGIIAVKTYRTATDNPMNSLKVE